MTKDKFYSGRQWVDNVADLPEGEHYVIVEDSTYLEHDGYNELHNNSPMSRTKLSYIVYETRKGWEAEIIKRSSGIRDQYLPKWKALIVRQPKVSVKVDVDIVE